ncbi:HAMP domain-containing protein [Candidatus Daviesbacteria bacterium]|nr:HAMP domain-containing protein [Candidatus Daviesbacteria bacterium]
MINLKSIKTRLFLWYIGSLMIVIAYFLLFIHYFTLPYAIHILIGIFIILAIAQFITLFKITKSISTLSSKIKLISSENLEEKITGTFGEDEIGELTHSFNSLLDRLHQAFKREQQFIADVAHELKTPLSTIKSAFEVALSKPRSIKEYEKVIEESIIETDQLSQTLKNILDLAWSETPVSQNNGKKFNLTELVADLYEIAQKLAVKKKIEVILSSAPDMFIIGFKEKLARVLLNLIDNAVKYSPQRGKIEIILEKSPTKALISIIDNGQGIAEEDLPQIFNRFYRGSKTDKVLGSGLGLAIAKSIITLHHGEMIVKSKKGKGSTFVVVLPLTS